MKRIFFLILISSTSQNLFGSLPSPETIEPTESVSEKDLAQQETPSEKDLALEDEFEKELALEEEDLENDEKKLGRIQKKIAREKNPEKYQNQYKNNIARQRCKEYYHNNKENVKDTYLQTNYGITLEDYNFLLEDQNKKCKICNSDCSTGKSLAVDHNHETGKVRGLLCKNCNIGLGMFFDNIDFLESAVLYLKSS